MIVTYYPDGTSIENANNNLIYGTWYFTDETAK